MPKPAPSADLPKFDQGKPKLWFTAKFLTDHVDDNGAEKKKAEQKFQERQAEARKLRTTRVVALAEAMRTFAADTGATIDLRIGQSKKSREVAALAEALAEINRTIARLRKSPDHAAWKKEAARIEQAVAKLSTSDSVTSTMLCLGGQDLKLLAGEVYRAQAGPRPIKAGQVCTTDGSYPYWQRGGDDGAKRAESGTGRVMYSCKLEAGVLKMHHLKGVK